MFTCSIPIRCSFNIMYFPSLIIINFKGNAINICSILSLRYRMRKLLQFYCEIVAKKKQRLPQPIDINSL